MSQPHKLLASLTTDSWALSPAVLSSLVSLAEIEARFGTRVSSPTPAAWEARGQVPFYAARGNGGAKGGGLVAVLPIHGVITPRGGWYSSTSAQQVSQWLSSALRDSSVSQILLDVDSPGGSMYGVRELAAEIFAARSVKPLVAAINCRAVGAAYWLASQAEKVYITPSGEAGGIGVSAVHQDHSGALANQGVKVTLISSGKHKTEGHPYGPLSTDSKTFMQGRLDEGYAAFTRDVARGRGQPVDKVRNGMGQGRELGAFWALAERMVDGIAPFDQVLRNMGGRPIGPDNLGGNALQTSGRTAAGRRGPSGSVGDLLRARLHGAGKSSH